MGESFVQVTFLLHCKHQISALQVQAKQPIEKCPCCSFWDLLYKKPQPFEIEKGLRCKLDSDH